MAWSLTLYRYVVLISPHDESTHEFWALCHHWTQQCLMSHAKTLLDSQVNFVAQSVMSCSEHNVTLCQGSQSEYENGM